MAKSVRDAKLDSRNARLKLDKGVRHSRKVSDLLALVYRRTEAGYGTWFARYRTEGEGPVTLVRLGIADDHEPADGERVLTFAQAQQKATAAQVQRTKKRQGVEYTVADAVADYLDWYKVAKKASGYQSSRNAAALHILPALGALTVQSLTKDRLRQWHQKLATAAPKVRGKAGKKPQTRKSAADPRARKATANRVLTVLKAALNRAHDNDKIPNDDAWRSVKPFKAVDAARLRFLAPDECTRLLNACAPEFRPMAQAALLTGCRYGELAALRVSDFRADSRTVTVQESKAGKPRHVPLTDEGASFFARQVAGKAGAALIFSRGTDADGKPIGWGQAHQLRPMRRAGEAAAIAPAVTFHDLRRTYGALLALRGVPLQVIAAALGHADTRITERHYAHLSPGYVADAVRANLPNFGIEADNVVALKSA